MTSPIAARPLYRRLILLILAGAIIILLLTLFFHRRQTTPVESAALFATATRGPLAITVRASGEIQSTRPNKVIPKLRRSANITYLLPEGTQVTNGEIVVQFNKEDLLREIDRAESQVVTAKNQRESAQTELDVQRLDNQTATRKMDQDLQTAQMELEKFLQGDEPNERRNADIKVQNAEGEYIRKKTRYEQYEELFGKGFVTESEVQEATLAMQTCKVALESAITERRLLIDYTHFLKITSLEANVERAETELGKVSIQNASRLRAREHNLNLNEYNLSRAQDDLDRLRCELDDYNVKAPFDGVVTYGDPDNPWRRGEIQVGSSFYPGQVLMSLPDKSEMKATVKVAEIDVHLISTGMTAFVRVEALKNQIITGMVTYVAEVAGNEAGFMDDVRNFKATPP